MNTTDDLRALLDEWKTLARRAAAPTPAAAPPALVDARAAARRDAARTVPRLVAAVEAVLDKERKPDPDTWDLWDWGYDLALDNVAGLIRAALTGDDKMTDPDHYPTGPDIIRQAGAEAWGEGHAAGCTDPYAKYGECDCGPNPYRERGEP